MEQLCADINPSIVNGLTQGDLGVWATPEGTAYIDGTDFVVAFHDYSRTNHYFAVLSSKKNTTLDTKGKEAEITRWEAEVKKSLASKKAAASATISLTKQEQTLVQMQLEK